MDGQGDVCVDELGGAELGHMEGEWDGIVTVGLLMSSRSVCSGTTLTDSRTTRSDWLAWETPRIPLERAVFALR